MKLTGKLVKGTLTINEISAENSNASISITERLEQCLIAVCKELDIPVPLWLEKNTREFVQFRRTIFFAEQFTEKVHFDRFEIKQVKS
ncbi:MAG: hypothetical protein PHV32_07450 [Eubacteriales bacterium]|nr:hypothetical protein [Eubacteriales bacterium]